MKSLLNALQEGRLVELPVNEKDRALEYLALLIEAIPDIDTNFDIVKEVLDREKIANTAIGMGVACPHVRSRQEGELRCAVGWSPQGIEYGAKDGKKVHLLVMYYIPNTQRNAYLKEISGLAKAISESEGIEAFANIQGIQSVRNKLLDWVELAINKAIPDSKARMIKIEGKQSTVASTLSMLEKEKLKTKIRIIPFSVVILDSKCIVMSQDQELVEVLEKSPELAKLFSSVQEFEFAGYQIAIHTIKNYAPARTFYEGVAIQLIQNNSLTTNV